MIKYGLKIWSNNFEYFGEVVERFNSNDFDFVEIYSNSDFEHNYKKLEILKQVSIEAVHFGNLNSAGFHLFYLTEEQKKPWQMVIDLTNFFDAPRIIVHPAVKHTWETFQENLRKLNDKRIFIETMPALSMFNTEFRVFGTTIEDFKKIKEKNEICFDIAKFIKACAYHKLDYKEYIEKALSELKPNYFHISGGDYKTTVDQHDNMWDGNADYKWIREVLEDYSKEMDIFLVFEVPKSEDGLQNDINNMKFFKNEL
jgi:sugar phosphate isomerase/epimerase